MDSRYLPWAAFAALAGYAFMRTKRGNNMIQKHYAQDAQEVPVPKYPYVAAKDRIMDPSIYTIVDPTFALQGLYGIERRDLLRDVGGTRTITYGDAFVNY